MDLFGCILFAIAAWAWLNPHRAGSWLAEFDHARSTWTPRPPKRSRKASRAAGAGRDAGNRGDAGGRADPAADAAMEVVS